MWPHGNLSFASGLRESFDSFGPSESNRAFISQSHPSAMDLSIPNEENYLCCFRVMNTMIIENLVLIFICNSLNLHYS